MLALLAIALVAGLFVVVVVSDHAGFGRHIGSGALVGAAGLIIAMLAMLLLSDELAVTATHPAALAVAALYGALSGAAGGSAAWVLRRLPAVSALFAARPGFDPEGERMDEEALVARHRQRLREARHQAEQELAAGTHDADLWQRAEDEAGSRDDAQRRRYIELRAERIVQRR